MRMTYLLNHVDTKINRTAKNDHSDEASVPSVDGLLSVSSSSTASKMRRYTWKLNGVHRTFMDRYIIWIFTFFVLVQFGTATKCTPTKVANSDKSVAGSLTGTIGSEVSVTCNKGYTLTQITCYKIKTDNSHKSDGYLTILLDQGTGYKIEKTSTFYDQGSTVFEECFSADH